MKLYKVKLKTKLTNTPVSVFIIENDSESAIDGAIGLSRLISKEGITAELICSAYDIYQIQHFAVKSELEKIFKKISQSVSELLKNKPDESILYESKPGVEKIMNHVHTHTINDCIAVISKIEREATDAN